MNDLGYPFNGLVFVAQFKSKSFDGSNIQKEILYKKFVLWSLTTKKFLDIGHFRTTGLQTILMDYFIIQIIINHTQSLNTVENEFQANVFCKQKGHSEAADFLSNSKYGQVPSKSAIKDILCDGSEPNLNDCYQDKGGLILQTGK